MTPLSPRLAVPLLVLALAAAVPVWTHALAAPRADDCADPAALLDTGAIPGAGAGADEPHEREWLDHWRTGELAPTRSDLPPPRYELLRSHAPAILYEGIVAFLPKEFVEDERRVLRVPADGGSVPVHVLYDHGTRILKYVAYVYVYDARPQESPALAHLASAVSELLSGARSLSVYMVSGLAPGGVDGPEVRAAAAWLAGATGHYRAVCGL